MKKIPLKTNDNDHSNDNLMKNSTTRDHSRTSKTNCCSCM